MKPITRLLVLIAVSAFGCDDHPVDGDADVDADSDADVDADGDADADADGDGDGDSDGDADAESDGEVDGDVEPEPLSLSVLVKRIDYRVPDLIGAPVPGALVALDQPSGRIEATADGDGRATLEVADGARPFTLSVAHPGFAVLTYSRMTRAQVDATVAHEGEFVVYLHPPEYQDPEDLVLLTVTITGLPDGVEVCVDTTYDDRCTEAPGPVRLDVRQSAEPSQVLAWVLGDARATDELVVLDLPDTAEDREVEVAFDGVSESTARYVDVTALVPDDPESVFQTAGLHPVNQLIDYARAYAPVELLTNVGRSVASELSLDGHRLDMTLGYFLHPDAADPFWYVTVVADFSRTLVYSNARLSHTPLEGTEIALMDVPNILEPLADPEDRATLDATFRCSPREGAAYYALTLREWGGYYYLWTVYDFGGDCVIELPDLPSEYDPWADWPEEGTVVGFDFTADSDFYTDFDGDDPERPLPGLSSVSEQGPVVLTWE